MPRLSDLPFFSLGFRPFFFGAALWTALAMALWLLALSGAPVLPSTPPAPIWHAHASLFGFTGAAFAGFLLTAVPNWTGRRPLAGGPLALLAALWLAGRIATLAWGRLPAGVVAAVELAFPPALAAWLLNELVRARNWRNLPVAGGVIAWLAGDALFHAALLRAGTPLGGVGVRLGLGGAIFLVAFIGGRIVPAFTRNWLSGRGKPLPAPPMAPFDRLALAVLVVALGIWAAGVPGAPSALGLLAAAACHGWRLARWRGLATLEEPLLTVLHVAYGFVPLGALALAVAELRPVWGLFTAAEHLWLAGGVGLMALAVMTRASLGHTGRPLTADGTTAFLYALVAAAALLRAATPAGVGLLWAGLAWIAAWGGFLLRYGPILWGPRADLTPTPPPTSPAPKPSAPPATPGRGENGG
ncbi:MAG: short-chain dehydrogenase [Porticoccaceae bacterium]|nr:MAG: short-chain dehydrogenase [Porticoccaceae bacterium]